MAPRSASFPGVHSVAQEYRLLLGSLGALCMWSSNVYQRPVQVSKTSFLWRWKSSRALQ
ncbi:8232_t:CDS:2 [Ambispora gerdemannii]|uniref:8232_t:CDS:1 n=1 Tax=Ambispora gerdemannii TaxID=144530 RepID=A0A9N9FHL9_9GLOM|nr:8232_t:CDS:2 [Ambispora gerdemannii]